MSFFILMKTPTREPYEVNIQKEKDTARGCLRQRRRFQKNLSRDILPESDCEVFSIIRSVRKKDRKKVCVSLLFLVSLGLLGSGGGGWKKVGFKEWFLERTHGTQGRSTGGSVVL
jgi:hypothetical protein